MRRLDAAEAGTHAGDWKVKNQDGAAGRLVLRVQQRVLSRRGRHRQVCLALSQVEHPNGRYQHESVQRAIDWVLSMQCRNGGWASFDKDNDRMVFQYVPFADHNAMLDPATVDITGRVLEMLAAYGYDKRSSRGRRRRSSSSATSRSRTAPGSAAGA